MSPDRKAVICRGYRTPIGRATKGALAYTRPDDFASEVIGALVERAGIEPSEVEDVVLGCATPEAEQGTNVARRVAMLSGLPDTVPGVTVSRYCGSSLEAVALATSRVMLGWNDLLIAGGLESMSMAPIGGLHPAKSENPRLLQVQNGSIPVSPLLQTAQYIAEVHGISREEQDAFALRSHERAVAAADSGAFAGRIVPVSAVKPDGYRARFETDECPRRNLTMEKLSSLPPLGRPVTSPKTEPTVTAGNSCPLNDGAAALFVTEYSRARDLGLEFMGALRAMAVAGVPPREMGVGPVPATRKALEKAKMTMGDIDLIEMNEAFASQCIYAMKELDMDPEKVNVLGGAIALGHPLGATGAILVNRLLDELKKRDLATGLINMCVADGQGVAMVLERVD